MDSRRGKPLTSEVKKIAVSVKQYFDRNKFEPIEPSTKRAADALGIGLATVKRIMADYNRDPELPEESAKIRGRPVHAVSVSYQEAVRSYVRSANQKGEYITLENIRDFLNEISTGEPFRRPTLARTLSRWGFEFGKGTRSQHLKEKDHVIAARQRYLRKKRENRIPGTDISIKIIVMILSGIRVKTVRGCKSLQERVNASSLSMRSQNPVGFRVPNLYLRVKEKPEIIMGK